MKLREEVARAICRADDNAPATLSWEPGTLLWQDYLDRADAVIPLVTARLAAIYDPIISCGCCEEELYDARKAIQKISEGMEGGE